MTMNDQEKKILTETHLMCTEMYKVLKGNGRPGLESRVVTIEADLKNHTKPTQWPAMLSAGVAFVMMLFTIYISR